MDRGPVKDFERMKIAMFRRPAVTAALAAAAVSALLLGATAQISAAAAIAALGAMAAAGIVLTAHLVSLRIENATARIEARLTLDQLQNGDNNWRLVTDYSATPDLILIVVEELLHRQPKVCVELGAGVSTLVLARIIRGQNLGCKLISIEHDAAYAAKLREEVLSEGLETVVTIIEAPLEPVAVDGYRGPWYSRAGWVDDLGPIEILLVDGPPKICHPEIRFAAIPLLAPRLAPGALIVLDDARRKPERRALAAWKNMLPGSSAEYRDSGHGIGLLRCAGRPRKMPS